MWSERYSKMVIILISIVFLLSLLNIMIEKTYEPEIQNIDIGNIEKSTSGIENVWPFETIIVNLDPEKFNEAVANGAIKLSLPDKDFELHLTEQKVAPDQQKIKLINESGIFILDGSDFHTYTGRVAGYENSSVILTIHRNLLFGTIDIENNPYHIDLTRKSVNGKTIMAVYRKDDITINENAEPATL